MRNFRNWERKHIPNIRLKGWYKMLKVAFAIPILAPIYYFNQLARYLAGKIRIKRSNKPDIVLQHIIEGWTNLLIPNPVTEELAMRRAKICATCPFAEVTSGMLNVIGNEQIQAIKGTKCTKCGCPLSAKIRSSNDRCPLGKW